MLDVNYNNVLGVSMKLMITIVKLFKKMSAKGLDLRMGMIHVSFMSAPIQVPKYAMDVCLSVNYFHITF